MKNIKTLTILLLFISIIATKLNGMDSGPGQMDVCHDLMGPCPDQPQVHPPFDFLARLNHANKQRLDGFFDEAKQLYRQIIERFPHVPFEIYIPALLNLGDLYFLEGNHLTAMQFFHSVVGHYTQNPTLLNLEEIRNGFLTANIKLGEIYFAMERDEYLQISWNHYQSVLDFLHKYQINNRPSIYALCYSQQRNIARVIQRLSQAPPSQEHPPIPDDDMYSGNPEDQTIVHGKRPAAMDESDSPGNKRERIS